MGREIAKEKRTMKITVITLTNEFHNREISLHAKYNPAGRLYLSAGQVKKAWNALCGIKGCTCCNAAGERPSTMNVFYDNHGKLAGAEAE
jgi:hypothetical protein